MALHKADECGILHGRAGHQPDDDHGCLLENGHDGPHEFADRYGQHWLWETDLSCECEWCMKAEGDYCTIYWRKPDDGAEREYVSWFPIAPKEAPSEASRGEVVDKRKPWEKSSWTCALARVDSEGVHCPATNRCPDCIGAPATPGTPGGA